MCQLSCACHITDSCETLWKRIRYLVELQSKECDTNSSEHLHSCQKLHGVLLIDQGFLRYSFKLYFDQALGDVAGCTCLRFRRNTRYKKAQLKECFGI